MDLPTHVLWYTFQNFSRNVSRRLQILQGKLLVSAEHTDTCKNQNHAEEGEGKEKR